jgi:hypothetical protein
MYRIIAVDISDPNKYIDLLRNSSPFHWTLLFLMLTIFVLEMATLTWQFFIERKAKPA